MFSFLIDLFTSNFVLPHSSNRDDFLDDADQGKDLESIDFDELNRIGENWEAVKGGDHFGAGTAEGAADRTVIHAGPQDVMGTNDENAS